MQNQDTNSDYQEPEYRDDNELNEAEESSASPWNGFLDIIHDPVSVGKRVLQKPGPIVAGGILVYMLGFLASSFIFMSNPNLSGQVFEMTRYHTEKTMKKQGATEEQIQKQMELVGEFIPDEISIQSVTTSLFIGLLVGAAAIFFFGGVYFLLARILVEDPPSYMQVAAITGYGFLLSSIGKVITGLMQYAGDSVFLTPSLTIFLDFDGPEPPLANMFDFLSKVNVFSIWEYVVVGIAVATAARLATGKGIMFGIVAFLVSILGSALGLAVTLAFS